MNNTNQLPFVQQPVKEPNALLSVNVMSIYGDVSWALRIRLIDRYENNEYIANNEDIMWHIIYFFLFLKENMFRSYFLFCTVNMLQKILPLTYASSVQTVTANLCSFIWVVLMTQKDLKYIYLLLIGVK